VTPSTTPDRTEAAEYYFTYIDKVPTGEILEILDSQLGEARVLSSSINDEQSLFRYAPDKWSIKQVMSHVNDTERLFVFRAFWFARGFDEPLPSFDQDVAVTFAGADERSWQSHIREFETVRAATMTFFRNLPEDAWARRGLASGNPFTVRALAYITAGHVTHHLKILRERYLAHLS
jgi:hypothetical protein